MLREWKISFVLVLILGVFPIISGFNAVPQVVAKNSTQLGVQSVSQIPKPEYEAFNKGEKLYFSMSYSFITAGHALFEILPDEKMFKGKSHFVVSVEGTSNSFFDHFFKVRDYYTSWMDSKTFLPSYYTRNTSEGGDNHKETYIFNQESKIADFGDGNPKQFASELFDIISCFYYVRNINFSNKKPGFEINFNTFFDKREFPVGVKYLGKGILKTSLGKFNVLKFQPKLIAGRVFKNQADMTLYVTDDRNQIPIRIKSAVYLDYVYADLIKMEGIKYPLDSKILK